MSKHNTTIYVIVHILPLLFHIFFTSFDFFNSEQTLYCRKKKCSQDHVLFIESKKLRSHHQILPESPFEDSDQYHAFYRP